MPTAPTRYQSDIEDSARWEGFEFRPDDIVISTPSKAGTTWTQMICALLIFQTPELPAPLTTLSPWLDMRLRPVGVVHAQLAAQQHRRFIKTHTPLDGLPRDDRVTYVVVARDPRDSAVSLYHQGANLDRDLVRELVSQSDPTTERMTTVDGSATKAAADRPPDERSGLLRWIGGEASPVENSDSIRGVIWHLAGAWERRHEPNVVLVHYSDLLRDLEAEMRRLAARLEIAVPEHMWPELVDAATFSRMRARADELVPDDRAGIMKSAEAFFRSGSSGGWRHLLSDEEVAMYHRRVAELAPADFLEWLHR